MAHPALGVGPLAEQEDAVLGQAGAGGGGASAGQELELGDEGGGAGVGELVGELGLGVEGVRGAGGAGGAQDAAGEDGGVDVVGGVEGEDVAAGPAPLGAEGGGEGGRAGAELGPRVGAVGPLAVGEDLLGRGEGLGEGRLVVAAEEVREDVDLGDGDGGVEGLVRHGRCGRALVRGREVCGGRGERMLGFVGFVEEEKAGAEVTILCDNVYYVLVARNGSRGRLIALHEEGGGALMPPVIAAVAALGEG